ncbi:MAG: hypothetical protein JOZ08_09405 [Verrucomicrobia bacterium]|nr:hypothetical protein [Verrucomicrobiota bacterium]
MARTATKHSIFINCPFDPQFQRFLRAILFTVCALGCKPRSALEESDSSTLRLEKIYKLIKSCRFSIHDLSRTEVTPSTGMPRFNMPLELGIFLGFKRAESGKPRKKTCLIFVKDKHSMSFITDLNGMDLEGHQDTPEKVISPIRNWLCNDAKIDGLAASLIRGHYKKFEATFETIVKEAGFQLEEVQYGDVLQIIGNWLENNPLKIPASAPQGV